MTHIIPLQSHLKALQTQASDADWNGEQDRAKRLYSQAKAVQARIEAGELYEVLF